jgi:small subunit ribosomal protein S17|tara:strand:+ start:667 stop:1209 length:543 start_codon:yes stop_codon:yes gene_type:complete
MVKLKEKSKVGKVISTKMDLTVVVAVTWKSRHIRYGKPVGKLSKFKAHDAKGVCSLGDLVKIIECRPISKTKRWLVGEVLESRGHSVVDKGFVDEQAASDKVVEPDPTVEPQASTEVVQATDTGDEEDSREVTVLEDSENGEALDINEGSNGTIEEAQLSEKPAVESDQESAPELEKDEG